MAFYEPHPVNASTGLGFVITPDARVADPFTASNITWTEIVNSTTEDWAGLWVDYQVGTKAGIILLAKGSAASEVIFWSHPTKISSNMSTKAAYCPIPLPSGTRISVGASTNTTVVDLTGSIVGIPSTNFDAEPTWTVFESGPYDLTASTSYGSPPLADPGGTINTKGSYTEASQLGTNGSNNVINGDDIDQVYDYFGMLLFDNGTSVQTEQNRLIDVAYGAAASEVIYMADRQSRVSSIEHTSSGVLPTLVPWGRAIGDRISFRGQSSITGATARLIGICLFGVR